MTKQKHIQCPYCHANASLRPASTVYGCNRRSQGKYIYLCDRWPACDAYVSAHDRTHRPMVRFETLNSNYCLSMAPFPLAACNPLPMVSLAACA